MRPIKIVMSAFGSYANEVTIDFTKAVHGIFLITGDTGAGKTTIFDAITFALYDRTSGGRRDGQMMRSQYAADETETYVEYTFSYQNDTYTVRRNPRYAIRSKRRNKEGEYPLVERKPSVELTMPDGSIFPGKVRETDAKIVEIIGLDADQFTQIAMIAQDEFMELLQAKSDDRKAIFSRIFNTRIYQRIQDELHERTKRMDRELEENKKMCMNEMEHIQCVTDSAWKEKWDALPAFTEVRTEEVIELLEAITEEAKKKEEKLQQEGMQLQKQLDEAKQKRTAAEQQNQQFNFLRRYQERQKKLQEQALDMQKKEQICADARRAERIEPIEQAYRKIQEEHQKTKDGIQQLQKSLETGKKQLEEQKQLAEESQTRLRTRQPVIEQELMRLEQSLPDYAAQEERKKEYQQQKKQEQALNKQLEVLQKEQKEEQLQRETLQKRQGALEGAAAKCVELNQILQECKKRNEEWNRLHALCKQEQELQCEQEETKKELERCLKEAEEKNEQYRTQNRMFIEEQAGIIAEDLTEGAPCPVCGSIHHPTPAKKKHEHISQERVEQARKDSEAADRRLNQAQGAYQKKATEHQMTEAQLVEQCSIFFAEPFPKEGREELFEAEKISLGNRWKETRDAYRKEEANSKQYQKDKKTLQTLQELSEIRQEKLRGFEKEVADRSSRIQMLQEKEQEIAKRLPFPTKQEAQAKIEILQREKDALLKEQETQSKKYEKYLETLRKSEGQQEELQSRLQELLVQQKTAGEQLRQALDEQQFATEEAYHMAKREAKEIERLQQSVTSYREECLKNTENLQRVQEQLEGKEPVDITKLQETEQKLNEVWRTRQAQEKEAYMTYIRNHEATEKIKKQMENRSHLAEQYTALRELDLTANGGLNKKSKIDFQTFIQRSFFQEIIREANKRLTVMTKNKFILQCRSMEALGTQGAVGLDLDVYQPLTGKTRDIKTLSGGESFMAALAMAFGMADVIQNTAGKVHLDMMFIDEGFGSLDENSRRQAIKVLHELAGDSRLIGIISHVTELQEQMERKLVVSKNEKGSSVRWEV